MVKKNLIIKSLVKSHSASLLGIFAFVLIVAGVCCSLFTVLHSTSSYEKTEIEREQFGDVSYWLTKFSSDEEKNELLENVVKLPKVEGLNFQNLIMVNYEIHHTESDSEGCFVVDDGRYIKLGIRNEELEIKNGQCFVPLSFRELYDGAEIGGTLELVVGRNGLTKSFVIGGFFEDPFMGSTLDGMSKSEVREFLQGGKGEVNITLSLE